MSRTTENQTFAPLTAQGEAALIPAPRRELAPAVDEDRAAELRARAALHSALGLTPDQAVSEVHAYNTWHSDREGARIPGGELVVRATIAGRDTGGEGEVRYIEIRDNERGGLDEETIAALGAQAMKRATVERIVL